MWSVDSLRPTPDPAFQRSPARASSILDPDPGSLEAFIIPIPRWKPEEIIHLMNNKTLAYIGWLLVAVLGAFALGAVALNRGETVSAV